MERLTYKEKNGTYNSKKSYYVLANKLAEYEDLEEQGLLIRLPCKVGDIIYRFWYADNAPYKVQEQTVRTLSNLVAIMESGEIGKTVFLTHEEAEAALQKMKEGGNE